MNLQEHIILLFNQRHIPVARHLKKCYKTQLLSSVILSIFKSREKALA